MAKNIRYEFLKLDHIDLSVACWIYEKHPKALYSYLEFISKGEYKEKGIDLNIDQLYQELLKAINIADKEILSHGNIYPGKETSDNES